MEHQFDEVAKALAEGVSRREALRRVAGALAGALLAGWGAGKAAAQAPASGCERYCRSLFDPRQSQGAFGACVSRCAVCLGRSGTVCGVNCCNGSTPACWDGECFSCADVCELQHQQDQAACYGPYEDCLRACGGRIDCINAVCVTPANICNAAAQTAFTNCQAACGV